MAKGYNFTELDEMFELMLDASITILRTDKSVSTRSSAQETAFQNICNKFGYNFKQIKEWSNLTNGHRYIVEWQILPKEIIANDNS